MSANRTNPERAAVKLELTVQEAVNSPGLPTNTELRRWLAAALEQSAAITVRFVGAAEGRRLNREYRDKDYATNVLSFGYGSSGRGQSDRKTGCRLSESRRRQRRCGAIERIG